ncbi:MAG: copper chaperone PCu(A)C [Gammaproteobacteria bacterium]|nr:copper chaperone PCu(A)C [Gammaproteobacteria bacterium]
MLNKKQKKYLLITSVMVLSVLAVVLLIPKKTEIQVTNAWVRAIPPGIKTTAAYMKIQNDSDTALELTHFESPQFTAVVAHETIIMEGLAQMIDAGKLIIPAKGDLNFSPEGLHLMLITSKVDLTLGTEIKIILYFSDKSQYTVNTKVESPAYD